MIYILFGLAGSGKNYVGVILMQKFGYCFWDADEALTDEMRDCISKKQSFTQEMRDKYCAIIIQHINVLKQSYANIVVAQGLYKNKNRLQILTNIPEAIFILISADLKVIQKRLMARNSATDEDYAKKISVNFEPPSHPHHSIKNDGVDSVAIEEQLTRLIKYFKISDHKQNRYKSIEMQGFGSKLHSGKISLWSHADHKNDRVVQVREACANNVNIGVRRSR